MGEKVTIPVELDVEDVRTHQVHPLPLGAGMGAYLRIADAARAAVLRYELPYEPSEQDVTDYCEAHGWPGGTRDRHLAADALRHFRSRGWDAVPRRIGDDR